VMSSRHGKGISVDQALSFAQHCCSGAKRKLLRNYVKVKTVKLYLQF